MLRYDVTFQNRKHIKCCTMSEYDQDTAQVTRTESFVNLDMCDLDLRADKQTDTQTDTLTAILFTPSGGRSNDVMIILYVRQCVDLQ